MIRDIDRLGESPFDVLVIGGGIYGAWTAYDAAMRGLRVALIDKGDWASATSSASSKLIHGGLRYLEQFHFSLVRRSLDERKRLARLAPHRVTPIRFLIPLYRHGRVGRLRLGAGLRVYEWLGGRDQPVDPHVSLARAEVVEQYPFINDTGLTGGLTYGDCQMDDAHFALEIVEGAYRSGAVAANYVQAERLLTTANRVVGARVADRIGKQSFDIRASVVVNTTGMWVPRFDDDSIRPPRIRLSKGAHLVLPPLPTRDAMLIMSHRDSRVIFIIPWYGRTLLGTTDTDYTGPLDQVGVDDAEIDYLLGEANAVIREPQWDRSMIEGRFAGVRALKHEPGKPPASVTREWVLESPIERLLVSIGGKFTSARADASAIVDRALSIMGKDRRQCATQREPLPWSPSEDFAVWKKRATADGVRLGLDPDTAEHVAERYGSEVREIQRLIEDNAALAERIDPRGPFCKAELVYASRYGMAVTLTDLLRRRTPILILSRARRAVVEAAADVVAPILGWSRERREREIEQTLTDWTP